MAAELCSRIVTVILWLLVTLSFAFTDGCKFGLQNEPCDYLCHCKNNERCDPDTGECPNGCDDGDLNWEQQTWRGRWYGPGCQIGNIVYPYRGYNEPYNLVDENGAHMGDRAADGNFNQSSIDSCAMATSLNNSNRPRASWNSPMGDYYVVLNVTVIGRKNDPERVRPLEVRLNHVTSKGVIYSRVCGGIPSNANVDFAYSVVCKQKSLFGNFLHLIHGGLIDPGHLTLCEVYVEGYLYRDCPNFYGPGCLKPCLCKSDCDRFSGYCNDSCVDGAEKGPNLVCTASADKSRRTTLVSTSTVDESTIMPTSIVENNDNIWSTTVPILKSLNNYSTFIAVLALVVALIAVVLGAYVVVIKRRKRGKQMDYLNPVRMSVLNGAVTSAPDLAQEIYANIIPSFPVQVENLRNHVQDLRSSGGSLNTDFEILQNTNENGSYSENIRRENQQISMGNDYEGSNYIDASYVHGYPDLPNVYIASTDPSNETVCGFWRMIWERRVCRIVTFSATQVVQSDANFWPENSGKQYEDVFVVPKQVEWFNFYAIRTFKVSYGESSYTLRQFHFTSWPETGVPASTSQFVEFHQKVRFYDDISANPFLVHCRNGSDATGIFIALDYLSRQARIENKVDVLLCVYKLRTQRENMFLTLDQYIFLLDALVELLHKAALYQQLIVQPARDTTATDTI